MFLRNIPVQIAKGQTCKRGVTVIPKATGTLGSEIEGGRSGLAQWAEGQEGRGGASHSIFGENTERTKAGRPCQRTGCPASLACGHRRQVHPGCELSRWRSACGRDESEAPGTRAALSAAERGDPGAPGPWLSLGVPVPASAPGSLAALGRPVKQSGEREPWLTVVALQLDCLGLPL